MSSSSASVAAALVMVLAACGGAPRRAADSAPHEVQASPGFWESQALEEPPAQPEGGPPRKDFEPGTHYEDWPDVYSGAPAGQGDGSPWSVTPAAAPAGPESQRPHHTLLGR